MSKFRGASFCLGCMDEAQTSDDIDDQNNLHKFRGS